MTTKSSASIKLSDYKLVVFDIDGTLIEHGQGLQPFTKHTLFRLRDYGIPFTLATGKSLPATRDLADELEINLPLILGNGTLIQTCDGKTFFRISLPKDVTRDVIDACHEHEQDLVLYIEDGLFVKKITENMLPIYGVVKNGLYEVGSWDNLGDKLTLTNKCVAVETQSPRRLLALENVFKSLAQERADVVRTSNELLEMMPKNVDKSSGLQSLCNQLGISLSEVMAFGDFDNDAQMLSAAGLGVVVEGASDIALQNADLKVETCAKQGPAHFLSSLLDVS